MSAICLSRSHALDATRRSEAFEQLSTHLSEALGAAVTSQDWTLDFKGKGFSGTVTLSDCHVECEIQLGMMMRPLKGVITREIEAGLAQYLGDTGH
jgi:putative polyhydroxyalkanoate system protein